MKNKKININFEQNRKSLGAVYIYIYIYIWGNLIDKQKKKRGEDLCLNLF